jgi:hypothetical protein
MKEDKMGGACSIIWSELKRVQNFGWKICREDTFLKTQLWKDITETYLKEIRYEGMAWIHLT